MSVELLKGIESHLKASCLLAGLLYRSHLYSTFKSTPNLSRTASVNTDKLEIQTSHGIVTNHFVFYKRGE